MKKYNFTIQGQEFDVQIKEFEPGQATVEVNGTTYDVQIKREVKSAPAIMNRAPISASPVAARKKQSVVGAVLAPLPGSIFKLNVKVGDVVKKGDVLLIMEAMKMENNVLAEGDGKVKTIHVSEGDSVLQGDPLVELT